MKYAEFVRQLISEFVTRPKELEVGEVMSSHAYQVTVRPSPSDIAKVIGGKAKMVIALTRMVHAAGQKNKEMVVLEIFEPKAGVRDREEPFSPVKWGELQDRQLCDTFSWAVKQTTEEGAISQIDIDRLNSERSSVVLKYHKLPPEDLQAAMSAVFRAIASARGRKINIMHVTDTTFM